MRKQKPKPDGEMIVVDTPLTYTVKQAAEILHTNESGIRALINSGKLRALRPRGTTLIYRKSLIEFIENCEGWNLSDPYNPVKIDYGDKRSG